MIDLSLHIYDIAQNSVDAGARNIKIMLFPSGFAIEDDGCGMDATTLLHACEEGYTTRRSGRGGRGLYLLKKNSISLDIKSKKDNGTTVFAYFPECFPEGDISKTMKLLAHCYPDIQWDVIVYETKEELYNENA